MGLILAMGVYYIDIHYKLSVARSALPIQLLVARHIKVVVLSVQADDLASPGSPSGCDAKMKAWS